MKVGFIGLGQMGSGMAASLMTAGHTLTVFNRSPEKMQPLVAQGARAAQSFADFADSDVVFTMLAEDKAVESVVFGENGLLRHLRPGAVHISSSTISVAFSAQLAAAHAAAGQEYISAPVFGRPDAAAAGQLFLVVAGKRKIIDQLQTLLDAV
ncbi:MAG: NAD(P)-dependent oxidoreductase, partial [Acidithiobacillus sp.]